MLTTDPRDWSSGVYYPVSDGKPIAEGDWHLHNMFDSIQTLHLWFDDDPDRHVGGNLFAYFEEGNPASVVTPDVFTTPKGGKHWRRSWKIWEEGVGPDAVLEVTSLSTRVEDEVKKFHIYRDKLKVFEYFIFDPEGEYLSPRVKGYRLIDGVYTPIDAVDGRIPSQVYGLHLEVDGDNLRFHNPMTLKRLPSPGEILHDGSLWWKALEVDEA